MNFALRTALLALVAAIGLSGPMSVEPAAAQTKVKMVLNWKYQGPHGWFFLAEDNGYFKDEGLEVTMDQGDGSGAAVMKVASGAYDIGLGDINALIEFASKKPDEAPLGVYMMYNRPPFTVAVRSDSPIKTPKDFEGRTLGGAPNDGALKLFPALVKIAKLDTSKIAMTNMAPNLREQMLIRGQVDGVFGFVNTIRFSAKLIGADPEKDLRFINYGDYGMDLYSNSIIVSRKLAKENPEAVKGFVRALNKGLMDALKNPKAAVAAVAKREPLINSAVELERFHATVQDEMNHPEIAKIGFGDIDDKRMGAAIDILVEANGLPKKPAVNEVFSRDFLPPKSERPVKLLDAKS